MNIQQIREICMALPGVTEDIKWKHDLVFMVAGKMFFVTGFEQTPVSASFKVTEDEFEELSQSPGFRPAPYVAKYKWVLVEDINSLRKEQCEHYIKQAYELVKAKLKKADIAILNQLLP